MWRMDPEVLYPHLLMSSMDPLLEEKGIGSLVTWEQVLCALAPAVKASIAVLFSPPFRVCLVKYFHAFCPNQFLMQMKIFVKDVSKVGLILKVFK